MENEIIHSSNEAETIKAGYHFAQKLTAGDTVALYGELGAGKTEFIKGICEYFEVEEIVSSPTFTVINQYASSEESGSVEIYHIDLYRIAKKDELDEIGFIECVNNNDSIKLIEWAEKSFDTLPKSRYEITIATDSDDEDKRIINITKFGDINIPS